VNWVDVLVVVVAVIAAASGAKQGVIIALPAFLGVLTGAVVGIKVAPLIVDMFEHPAAKVAFAVATVVFLVALGETFGVWIGRTIKNGSTCPSWPGWTTAWARSCRASWCSWWPGSSRCR